MIEDLLVRAWQDLVGRADGPLSPRFIIQPLVSIGLAIRAGLKDAAVGEPPYLWTIWHHKRRRRLLLREGWSDLARLAAMACVLDGAYQLFVFRWFYPLETIIIVCLLAVAPYALIRGPINRLARRLVHR